MFSRFRVNGKSMEPTFREEDYVIASKLPYLFSRPKKGDAVVVKHHKMLMLKRVAKTNGREIFVAGDNERSRFAVATDAILGKILFRIRKNQ